MNQLVARAYAGASDLKRLIEFAQNAARARWPRSTYKKAGDVVWMMLTPGFDPCANIRLWLEGGNVAAYAWFEPPINLEFDIRPGLTFYDSLGDEILEWGETRRLSLAQSGNETIPKALA